MATGCCVLVVEDEEQARKPIEEVLRLMGFTVRSAATLADALDQLDGQECLLLDIHLPDGLGTTILRKIRTEQRPIQVAVLTGTSQPQIDRELEQLAPDALFRKPIQPDRLFDWLVDVSDTSRRQ
jgi:CheY-like chemotaxis protein